MKTTIGRIVHYNVDLVNDPDEIRNNVAIVLPAVIVCVFTDDCVNLKILTDGPVDVWKTSVVRGNFAGQWDWPPIL
jgi:hypothetical protein